LTSDRDRFATLARLVTLAGLKGPGVVFEDLGRFTGKADSAYAGTWQRVRRTHPDSAPMLLYLARKGADGPATHPGIIELPGDAATRRATERFRFAKWKDGPKLRYPGKIQADLREDWKEGATYKRFLLAFPEQLQINESVPASRFEKP